MSIKDHLESHGTRVSTWLIVAALMVGATQMQPSFADLIAIPVMAALMFLAQYFATHKN